MSRLPLGAITQTNYVTPDLERSVNRWVDSVKAGPFFFFELPDPALTPTRTCRGRPARDTFKGCYGFLGSMMIEIMQPTNDEPSLLREVLDVKGEAVQHIFPRIRPLAATEFDTIRDGYINAGYHLASEADAPNGGRTAFFDALHTIGAFIELHELTSATYEAIEFMHSAHVEWDGAKRPMPTFAELVAQLREGKKPAISMY